MNDTKILRQYIERIEPENTFYIDIGAGGNMNIPDDFIRCSTMTILCDGEEKKLSHPTAQSEMTDLPNIETIYEFITPDNIRELLVERILPSLRRVKDYGQPKMVDIDIDGYDFYVLKELLKEYTPTLIMAEINEKIPPPIKFAVRYSTDYKYDGSHFYGCSLSKYYELLSQDYDLINLTYNNAYFVLKNQNPGFPIYTDIEAYDKFYRTAGWEEHLSHNKGVKEWLLVESEKALNLIEEFFCSIRPITAWNRDHGIPRIPKRKGKDYELYI